MAPDQKLMILKLAIISSMKIEMIGRENAPMFRGVIPYIGRSRASLSKRGDYNTIGLE